MVFAPLIVVRATIICKYGMRCYADKYNLVTRIWFFMLFRCAGTDFARRHFLYFLPTGLFMSDIEDVPVGESPNDVVGPVMPEFDYSELVEDAAPASYGLESITLHHSFKNVRGRTIHIDCSKRTHLGGVNGAGKTSILALIPAFTVKSPSELWVKALAGCRSWITTCPLYKA